MRRARRGFGAVCAAVAVLAICCAGAAGGECLLRGGETIVFFGDSITQGGAYIDYTEAFLAARFPDKTFRIVNAGISSETISGTSETDHNPRRPWAHDRFFRDVPPLKPHIVIACFGMNDGNYHPFERVRFQKFQAGVRLLIERVRETCKARLVLLTPPPFDPYRRRAADQNAKEFGYKFPAVDYDYTLEVYSQWLMGLRREGFVVADVHSATNAHLRARRRDKVSFFLAGDAVHPNATGHWLMAQTLLEALGAPATVAEAEIDATTKRATRGSVADVAESPLRELSFTWTTPLPLPMDPRWDKESIALEKTSERLSRFTLTVLGLAAARYRLEADDTVVGEVKAEDLAKGLDLTTLPKLPANAAAQHVLGLIQRRRQTIYKAWRRGIATGREGEGVAAIEKAEKETADLLAKAREMCKPKPMRLKLVPL